MVDLEEEVLCVNLWFSLLLFEELEDEKCKFRKYGKKWYMRIEEYVNFFELSLFFFVDWEDEEGGVMEEDEEDEEEEWLWKFKKYKKKWCEKFEMVDDSDDEDFDLVVEMRRKRFKVCDFFVVVVLMLLNILVERIDFFGDEVINKNLYEIFRLVVVVLVVSFGLG